MLLDLVAADVFLVMVVGRHIVFAASGVVVFMGFPLS